MNKQKGWIGVDLDGTLAHYDKWVDELHIGKPIPAMVKRVQQWLSDDIKVWVFTPRVAIGDEEFRKTIITMIQLWCDEHIGVALPVTCSANSAMLELWSSRVVQVVKNTGKPVNTKGVGFAAGGEIPQ